MKKGILIATILTMAASLRAQDFSLAGGFRFWSHQGVSIKAHTFGNNVAEGMLGFNEDGFIVTGLLEHYKPISHHSGWWWYYGFGAHVGTWRNDFNFLFLNRSRRYSIGGDAILGIEYSLKQLPFSFSMDWKPSVNVLSRGFPGAGGVGLSIRYLIR